MVSKAVKVSGTQLSSVPAGPRRCTGCGMTRCIKRDEKRINQYE